MKLSKFIKQDRFASPGQESLLSIIVTGNWIMGRLSATMAPFGVTPAQYNVLRILWGSHPETLTCSEIGQRLLDRTPDVTRLLNRLERSGYVTRARAGHDRRVVEVALTSAGIDLLERMHAEVEGQVAALTQHLPPDEHRQLCDLLELLRAHQDD